MNLTGLTANQAKPFLCFNCLAAFSVSVAATNNAHLHAWFKKLYRLFQYYHVLLLSLTISKRTETLRRLNRQPW